MLLNTNPFLKKSLGKHIIQCWRTPTEIIPQAFRMLQNQEEAEVLCIFRH